MNILGKELEVYVVFEESGGSESSDDLLSINYKVDGMIYDQVDNMSNINTQGALLTRSELEEVKSIRFQLSDPVFVSQGERFQVSFETDLYLYDGGSEPILEYAVGDDVFAGSLSIDNVDGALRTNAGLSIPFVSVSERNDFVDSTQFVFSQLLEEGVTGEEIGYFFEPSLGQEQAYWGYREASADSDPSCFL